MEKVHNIYIGSKYDLGNINTDWAVVHACKTSHQQRLGYFKPIKGSPNYIQFRDGNHLYLNWVDAQDGKFFQVQTFINALDFIDENIKERKVFIHCDQGESRSPTLGLVYLAKRTDYLSDEFAKAYSEFIKLYPIYSPKGIIKFTQANWEKVK